MASVSKEVGASFCLPGGVFESFSKMDIKSLCICKSEIVFGSFSKMDIKSICICRRVSKELIDASFFLPDEIVVQVLSKVTDLRTLCICKRVSKRFNQIVCQVACQVDNISLIAPFSWETDNNEFHEDVNSYAVLKRNHDKNFYGTRTGRRYIYFDGGLIDSMTKFSRLKSMYIKLPSSYFRSLPFLKWKAFIAGNRIKSFLILSPRSIHDTKGSSYRDHEKEEPTSFHGWYCDYRKSRMYLEDAFVRYMMLFGLARECPVLEKITITDSRKMGRITFSGAKLSEVRKSSTTPPKVDEFRNKVSFCHIPLLDLPVAGCVMKWVELVIFEDVCLPSGYSYDRYINIDDDEDDFEDKEEAAYSEAVREIFKKHRDKIGRWRCRNVEFDILINNL